MSEMSHNVEDHSYFRFLRVLLEAGIPVQWDDREATITIGSRGTQMKALFSYNEPKIYFTLPGRKSFRVLDNASRSAEVVLRIHAAQKAFDSALDELIADVDE